MLQLLGPPLRHHQPACASSVCVTLDLCYRWTVGDASIFSVDDGKRLAQTPHKPLTFYERIRLEKQQKAAIETPLVKGIRLLPEFTPGRAMLWGSILAVWGTAAIVMSTAKSLNIKTVSQRTSARPCVNIYASLACAAPMHLPLAYVPTPCKISCLPHADCSCHFLFKLCNV